VLCVHDARVGDRDGTLLDREPQDAKKGMSLPHRSLDFDQSQLPLPRGPASQYIFGGIFEYIISGIGYSFRCLAEIWSQRKFDGRKEPASGLEVEWTRRISRSCCPVPNEGHSGILGFQHAPAARHGRPLAQPKRRWPRATAKRAAQRYLCRDARTERKDHRPRPDSSAARSRRTFFLPGYFSADLARGLTLI
jgi:hypothetical protein